MNDLNTTKDNASPAPGELELVRERRMKMLHVDTLVVALSLAIFLLFLWLLATRYFPAGTDLLDGESDAKREAVQDTTRKTLSYEGAENDRVVAQLIDLRRNVKMRPSEAPAWEAARQGDQFRVHDSLQTMARSSAVLRMADAGTLNVGPDSLIVFQQGAVNHLLPEQTNTMVLIDGLVDGNLALGALPSRQLEFVIPGGRVQFQSDGESGEELAFKLSINPDQSSSLAVYAGVAEVTAGGRTVRLGSRQGVTISNEGMISGVRRLPSAPIVNSPADHTKIRFRNLTPPVAFSWSGSANASQYRFELARDPEFSDVVADTRLTGSSFEQQNLNAGSYFWRVTALDGWHPSRPSSTRRLSVLRDHSGPQLDLSPAALVPGNSEAIISGQTDSESAVFVQGERAERLSNGQFHHLISLHPGANLITVEAVDAVGNISYLTQFVHAGPSAGGGD